VVSFRSWAPRLLPWAALLEAVLGLLERPADLYRQSGPKFCCPLNQATFEKLYVLADEISGETLGAVR